MTETEKLILEQLAKLSLQFTEMQQDITEIKEDVTELKVDVAELKEDVTELKEDVAQLKVDVDGLKRNVTKLEQHFVKLEESHIRLQLLIENDISRKIDIIGEGHDFLNQRLGNAEAMGQKREIVELEQINHGIEIKKTKQHIGIM